MGDGADDSEAEAEAEAEDEVLLETAEDEEAAAVEVGATTVGTGVLIE